MDTSWFAFFCFITVVSVMTFLVVLARAYQPRQHLRPPEATRGDSELEEMLKDPQFTRWADRFGLSYGERHAAWAAWNASKKPVNPPRSR